MKYYTSKKVEIILENTSFGDGAEGTVHKIISPSNLSGMCVKLYRKSSTEKFEKIKYLISNTKPSQSDLYRICFPVDCIFTNQNIFAGYMMQLAFSGSIQLEAFTHTIIRKKYTAHQKFSRILPDSFEKRLKLCSNIAIAFSNVHSLKKFVFVDSKPQNILISPLGQVTLIDIDSIQVSDENNRTFKSGVFTPDYSPPETQVKNKTGLFHETVDRFALSVIFYEIFFGVHPYCASFNQPYSNLDTIDKKIKCGLFVHGINAKNKILSLPKLHLQFDNVNDQLKNLFWRAFEEGLMKPDLRPSASEWGELLHKAIVELSLKKNTSQNKNTKNEPSLTNNKLFSSPTNVLVIPTSTQSALHTSNLLSFVFYAAIVAIFFYVGHAANERARSAPSARIQAENAVASQVKRFEANVGVFAINANLRDRASSGGVVLMVLPRGTLALRIHLRSSNWKMEQ